MFSNKRSEEKNNPWKSIDAFDYESLQIIVQMIDYLSRAKWVYVKDENDTEKTHFKLGKGTLDFEGVAMMTSNGALIDFKDSIYRIFKINMEQLQKSYDIAKAELLSVDNDKNLHPFCAILTEELLAEMHIEEKSTGCSLM